MFWLALAACTATVIGAAAANVVAFRTGDVDRIRHIARRLTQALIVSLILSLASYVLTVVGNFGSVAAASPSEKSAAMEAALSAPNAQLHWAMGILAVAFIGYCVLRARISYLSA